MTDGVGSRPIRVLHVDDHGVVRRGLRGYLELLDDIEVVGEAKNGLQGVEASAELGPTSSSWISSCRSNNEIAPDLGITEPTARTHVSNILGKLDLQSRTQAALDSVERKLVHD